MGIPRKRTISLGKRGQGIFDIHNVHSCHVKTECLLSNRKPASYVHLNLKMEYYFVQMLEALGYDIELTYVKREG